jgi:hypothetical protein
LKTSTKIKTVFENYLDVIHDSYFSNNDAQVNTEENNNMNNIYEQETNNSNTPSCINIPSSNKKTMNNSNNLFKFSSLDLLVNPLRQKYIWESWSPYEIALFECCVCKFGRNFDFYTKIVNHI